MPKNPNPVSLAEAKRLVSAKVRAAKTSDDVFIKGVLFLERNSTWKRRSRKPRQEPGLSEMVQQLEARAKIQ